MSSSSSPSLDETIENISFVMSILTQSTTNSLLVRLSFISILIDPLKDANYAHKMDFKKRQALSLFSQLCKHPLVHPAPYIDSLLSSKHFVDLLVSDSSLLASSLQALTSISAAKQFDAETRKILILLHSALCSASSAPSTRAICLHQYASLLTDRCSRSILVDFLKDSDARVRSSALRSLRESILKLNHSNCKNFSKTPIFEPERREESEQDALKIEIELYGQSVAALSDDSEIVRLEALRTIWVLANRRRESLVDDAFRKICNMVSDTSVRVRSEACGLLGTLNGVSETLLLQSLSKNLLKVRSDPLSQTQTLQQSGMPSSSFGTPSNQSKSFSDTSKKEKTNHLSHSSTTQMNWKEDPFDPGASAPSHQSQSGSHHTATLIEVEVVLNSGFTSKSKLIDSGANGAFVHGLEDEFKEVRDAALSSICELSHKSRTFALKSTEFFVDMFNDEIDVVRVHALHSVSRIGRLIFLTEEQLVVVLAMLDDATQSVRDATRKLLASIRLIGAPSLLIAVTSLTKSIIKHYPERAAIMPAYAALGRNHPNFTELLFEDLLKIDSRYILREPRLDDLTYVSVAILILNAAKENANLLEMLPPFLRLRHYIYLRRHYPLLIPRIPAIEDNMSSTLSLGQATVSDQALLGIVSSRTSLAKSPSKLSYSYGFPLSPDMSHYGPASSHLSSMSRSKESLKIDEKSISEESFFLRLQELFSAHFNGEIITQDDVHAFAIDLAPLRQALTRESNFKNETNFSFSIAYLDLLETMCSQNVSTDASVQKSCYSKTMALRSMFLGLNTVASKTLDALISLWCDLHTLSSEANSFDLTHAMWSIAKRPIRALQKLKKCVAVIDHPEPGSTRDYNPSAPLEMDILADITNIDNISGLCVAVSCDNPNFRQIFKLPKTSLVATKPLSYSVMTRISIPTQRWEHNKNATIKADVGKISEKGDIFASLSASPVSFQLKIRAR